MIENTTPANIINNTLNGAVETPSKPHQPVGIVNGDTLINNQKKDNLTVDNDRAAAEALRFSRNLNKFDSQIHKLFPGLAKYNKEYVERRREENKDHNAHGPTVTTLMVKTKLVKLGSRRSSSNFSEPSLPSAVIMSDTELPIDHSRGRDGKGGASSRGQKSQPVKRVRKKTVLEKAKEELQTDPEIIRELVLGKRIGFYQFKSDIGSGNFSQVKMAIHCLTNEKVAIKILDKTKLDQKTRKLLSREVFIMELLHHPHIIRIYEVIDSLTKINIIMEYASGGELYTKINRDGRLSEHLAKKLFSQVVSAVEHLHEKGIVHRDIKAENIFFFTPNSVKVGDFGFSTTCSRDQLLTTYCGSPLYAAPELFKDEGYIGRYVDIWALGILLYYMVTAKMPFVADTMGRLKKIIMAGIFYLPPCPPGSFDSDDPLSPKNGIGDGINNGNISPAGPGKTSKKISAFLFDHFAPGSNKAAAQAQEQDAMRSSLPGADYPDATERARQFVNGHKSNSAKNSTFSPTLTLTPECKYIIRGLLKTTPPSSRMDLAEIKRSEWMKEQVFPKSLSPIRINPPIDQVGQVSTNDEDKPNPVQGSKTSTYSMVDPEFEEVRKELLELGITDAHLKEALSRNSRNSIIGTYRILLHKVHKSQKTLVTKKASFFPKSEGFSEVTQNSNSNNRNAENSKRNSSRQNMQIPAEPISNQGTKGAGKETIAVKSNGPDAKGRNKSVTAREALQKKASKICVIL